MCLLVIIPLSHQSDDSVDQSTDSVCSSNLPDPFRLEYGSIRKALHGIPETHNENWKEIEANIRCVINEKLHLDSSQMVIEHAHGTGNPSGYAGKRPMPIVIKFLRYKDEMAVLGKGKDLKGTNIYVNEDYTEAVYV